LQFIACCKLTLKLKLLLKAAALGYLFFSWENFPALNNASMGNFTFVKTCLCKV
jgi:hypothetical protein